MTSTALRNAFWKPRAIAFWTLLFGAALLLDGTLARIASVHWRTVKHHSTLALAIKEMGSAHVAVGVAVLLYIFHPRHLWAGTLLVVSGVIGGLLEVALKWMSGRVRPLRGNLVHIEPYHFEFFRGGIAGINHQHNLCFPSGHTTLAFATAACAAHLVPSVRVPCFFLATLVAIERVAELAHYPSDVVAGAICGVLSFHLARQLFGLFDSTGSMKSAGPIDPAGSLPSASQSQEALMPRGQ